MVKKPHSGWRGKHFFRAEREVKGNGGKKVGTLQINALVPNRDVPIGAILSYESSREF